MTTQLRLDLADPDEWALPCRRCGAAEHHDCVCCMVETHEPTCQAIHRSFRQEKTKRVPVEYATPRLCNCDGPRARGPWNKGGRTWTR